MSQIIRHQAWIALAAGLVLFANLGVPRLWDDDEPRNATCAREMAARGDWVVPTFNQELRADKPVMIYWLMHSAYAVFGDNEFAARFWSAALALGTSLLTYHLGRLLFRAEVGLWAGLIVATALMFDVSGRAATPDSTLVFFSTLALLAFVAGVVRSKNLPADAPSVSRRFADLTPRGGLAYASMYVAMGLAVLAKGPVGVLLPTAAIGLYLLCVGDESRRLAAAAAAQSPATALGRFSEWLKNLPTNFPRAAWALRPWLLVAIVLLVAAPWYISVGMRTDGEWLKGFFVNHNFGRFAQAREGHGGPIIYYLPAVMIGFFPWSSFLIVSLLAAINRIRQHHLWRAGSILLACWIGVYVTVFSLAGTKLPSYVLPIYPALALLVGMFFDQWIHQPASFSRWWLWAGFASLTAVGVGLLVGLPILARRLLPGEALLGLIGLAPIAGAVGAFWFSRRGKARRAVVALCASSVALAVGLFGVGAARVSQHQNSAALVAAVHRCASGTPQIAAFGYSAPSLVFYAHEHVDYLRQPEEVRDYFAAGNAAGAGERFLILPAQCLADLQHALPAGVEVLEREPRFLRKDDMVLLGRAAQTARVTVGSAAAR